MKNNVFHIIQIDDRFFRGFTETNRLSTAWHVAGGKMFLYKEHAIEQYEKLKDRLTKSKYKKTRVISLGATQVQEELIKDLPPLKPLCESSPDKPSDFGDCDWCFNASLNNEGCHKVGNDSICNRCHFEHLIEKGELIVCSKCNSEAYQTGGRCSNCNS